MTIAVKITATALALTAVAAGGLVIGLVFLAHTHERKIAAAAGETDE